MANDKYDKGKAGKRSKESLGAMWANIKARENSAGGKTVKNELSKKTYQPLIISVVICLVVGALIGYFALMMFTKNDCFEIIGQEEITIPMTTINFVNNQAVEIDNSYYDKGVKVISFGRDISKDVYIETDLKQNEDGSYYADEIGTYYIIYKVDDIKYGKIFTVERIRLITFVEGTPDNKVD